MLTSHKRTAARIGLRLLAPLGEVIAALGALALCVGAALPWAMCTIFRVPIYVPGLFLGGAVTGILGALAFYLLRRLTIASIVFGAVAIVCGVYAEKHVGSEVIKVLLRIENALAPLNSHLAQAGIPGIECVSGIGPARSYLGPGIICTIWGGAATTVGAGMRFAGLRLVRTCFHCGYAWAATRAKRVRFCPRCGTSSLFVDHAICATCYQPVLKHDKFCITCGTQVKPVIQNIS